MSFREFIIRQLSPKPGPGQILIMPHLTPSLKGISKKRTSPDNGASAVPPAGAPNGDDYHQEQMADEVYKKIEAQSRSQYRRLEAQGAPVELKESIEPLPGQIRLDDALTDPRD